MGVGLGCLVGTGYALHQSHAPAPTQNAALGTVKSLGVAGDALDLLNTKSLLRLTEATGAGGQFKTYRLFNDTAEAFGIRQMQFSDTLSIREDDSLSEWRVQFGLTEKLSNPKRVETCRTSNPVVQQAGTGAGVVDPVVAAASEPEPGAPELTGSEAVLKRMDDYLGPTP